jgi:ABC-type phosphate transport system ATPase subunit
VPGHHRQRNDLSVAPKELVRLDGLAAGYGERRVLGPLSLVIAADRTTVLLGPGGAGKSTLLRLLYGAQACPAELWWCGGMAPTGLAVRRLQQRPFPVGGRTVGEQLRSATGLEPAAAVAAVWGHDPAAEELLTLLDRPAADLAAGPLRGIFLTATLAVAADLVLLDEPDADLEDPWREWVLERVVALRGTATVVLATHHLGFAQEAADDVVVLVDGRLIEAGATAQMFANAQHPRARHFLRMGS